MMTIRKTILLLIFTVLSGCGNNKAYTCKVDEQLLDLDLACFLDEDCPCGTHCDMGMCGYECTSNRDCDNGTKCDAFGRCSDKKSPSHALPPATAPGGTLELQTPSLVLRDAGETRALALRATHVNSGSIRVKAGPDLEVQCTRDATFGQECWLDGQAPDAEVAAVVHVRSAVSLTPDVPNTFSRVDFWSEHNGHTIAGVTLRNTWIDPSDNGARDGVDASVTAGLYSGTLTLTGVRMAVVADDPEFTPPTGAGLALPVVVEVQPDGSSFGLSVDDAAGAVFDGTILYVDMGSEVVTSAEQLFLDNRVDTGTAAAQIEIARQVRSDGTVSLDHETLSASLVTSFPGMAVGATPELRWSLGATRTEDLDPQAFDAPQDDAWSPASTRSAERWPAQDLGVTTIVEAICGTGVDFSDDIALAPDPIASGDLGCGPDHSPALTFPMVLNTTNGGTAALDFVQTCIDELASCNTWTCDPVGVTSCVDAQRVLAGTVHVLEDDLRSAADERAAHRLIQQWLTTHAWLATESHGAMRLATIMAPTDGHESELLETLDRSLDGWDLLLHPKAATGLLAFHPDTLNDPDYRCDHVQDPCGPADYHDQYLGLPVTILASLSNQAQALERSYEHAQYEQVPLDEVQPVAARYLRTALVLRGYAEGLRALAQEENEWSEDWTAETERFTNSLADLLDRIAKTEAGDNPLGIDEVDLPLYGVGDETSEQDRFFALSDYLLGTGSCNGDGIPGGRAWESCDNAQFAFDEAFDSMVDTADRTFSHARYMESREFRESAVLGAYGGSLSALCGWPAEAEVGYGDLYDNLILIDPDTCFRPGGPLLDALGVEDSPADCGEPSFAHATAAELGEFLCTQGVYQDITVPVHSDPACESTMNELWELTSGYTVPFDDVEPSYVQIENTSGWERSTIYTIDGESVEVTDRCWDDVQWPELSGDALTRVLESTETCQAAVAGLDLSRPEASPESCSWSQECPLSMRCEDAVCVPETPADSRPECFRGSLGVMALSVAASAKEVLAAQQELQDYVSRYEIAIESCAIQAQANDEMEDQTKKFHDTMEGLRATAATADGVAAVAQTA